MIKINSKHNKETKQIVVKAYHEGVCVSEIVKQFDIPRSTVYSWIKAHLQSENDQKESRLGDYHKLKEKIKKQEIMIEILQRAYGASELPVRQKLYFAESIYSEYSVHAICDALLLSRGTFYNHLKRNKRYNAWYEKRKDYLRQKILEVYHNNNQIYGAEKITVVLKNKGEKVSVKMVRMLMKDMGLSSIRQEAKDMYDKEKQKHKNYLNQKFHVEKPNEVWVSDITFIPYLIEYGIDNELTLISDHLISQEAARNTIKNVRNRKAVYGDKIFDYEKPLVDLFAIRF